MRSSALSSPGKKWFGVSALTSVGELLLPPQTRYPGSIGVKGLYSSKTAPLGATTSEKSHVPSNIISFTHLFQNYFNFHTKCCSSIKQVKNWGSAILYMYVKKCAVNFFRNVLYFFSEICCQFLSETCGNFFQTCSRSRAVTFFRHV